MFSLKEPSKSQVAAGITFSDEGIALAIVKHGSLSPILEVNEFIPCLQQDQLTQLSLLVSKYKLDQIPCNCILLPREYELIQVDAPEVANNELTAALRWKIKDILDFHIDDAVIDHIDMPDESTSGKRQLLVVASKDSVIRRYVDQLKQAGCQLASIDIAIQAARNIIVKQLPNSINDSIGLVNLWDEQSKISVLLKQDVYINRTSTIGLDSLEFVNEDDSNSQLILDSLALELQRTFDYYESHSRQAPISQVVVAANEKSVVKLTEMLQQRLGIECINIDLTEVLTLNEQVSEVDPRCICAIGGALREFS